MEEYTDSSRIRPVMLGIASLLPFVGNVAATADQLVTEHVERERQERLETLLEELETGLEDFGGPIPIHRSNAVLHAAYITIEATLRTHRREKIRAFARLLLSGLGETPAISMDDEHEDYLKILDDLSLRELRLLALLDEYETDNPLIEGENDVQRTARYWEDFEQNACRILNIPRDEISGLLSRLTRTGTYEIFTGAYFDYIGGRGKLTGNYRRLASMIKVNSQYFDSGRIV